MSDVAKIRRMLGMSQQAVADKASLTRSIITEVESKHKGLSVAAATKAAPVLGVGPGTLYLGTQLAAVKAKLEEGEITEDQASEKLLRVLRTVLEKFEDIEDEEGADELITALEEALTATTSATVENVRGSGSKATATKSAGMHAAFKAQMDRAGTSVPRAEDYDVDDSRDLLGRKVRLLPEDYGDRLDTDDLGLEDERGFPDAGSFDTSNQPIDAYDDGRDVFGRRTRPLGR